MTDGKACPRTMNDGKVSARTRLRCPWLFIFTDGGVTHLQVMDMERRRVLREASTRTKQDTMRNKRAFVQRFRIPHDAIQEDISPVAYWEKLDAGEADDSYYA